MSTLDKEIGTESSQCYLRRLNILNTIKKLDSEDLTFGRSLKVIYKKLDDLSPLEREEWETDGCTLHIIFDAQDELAAVLAWNAAGSFPGGKYNLTIEISCDRKLLHLDTYHEGKDFDHLTAFKDIKGQWHLRNSNERETTQNYLRESQMLKKVAKLTRINPLAWFLLRRIRKALNALSIEGEAHWKDNTMFDIAFENADEAAAELVWRAYGIGYLKVTHQMFIEKNCIRVATYYKGSKSLQASLYAFKDKGRYRVCLVGG